MSVMPTVTQKLSTITMHSISQTEVSPRLSSGDRRIVGVLASYF